LKILGLVLGGTTVRRVRRRRLCIQSFFLLVSLLPRFPQFR
jgi:hypothetical protein